MKSSQRGNPLQTDPQLRPLLRQVAELERLLARLRRCLPPEVAACCRAVTWSGSQLLVAVSSGAAAQRLRHCAPAAIRALQDEGVALDAIVPRISSALLPAWQPPKQLQLSNSAAAAFDELAGQVRDPELKAAVEALLRHHGKRP
ncbi:DciA family protein [Chitinilyticum litopenaei]|uniref:DciA family protein n=1 Tax=Chitinilyticum litopenaei TaxID=1121276 RepID=UPI000408125C|nr:DciA family protein [Chitinilyticum litopenaei]